MGEVRTSAFGLLMVFQRLRHRVLYGASKRENGDSWSKPDGLWIRSFPRHVFDCSFLPSDSYGHGLGQRDIKSGDTSHIRVY